jgi:hydrogenase maturation protease
MTHATLVIGLGDLTRGDDAVGPLAAAALTRRGVEPDVVLLDTREIGTRMLPVLAEARHVLVICAVRLGAAPGTLHRLKWSAAPDDLGPGLPAFRSRGIEILRMLDVWLDAVPDLVVLGVEALRPASLVSLSAPVARALPDLGERAAAELRRWGHRVGKRPAVAAGGLAP